MSDQFSLWLAALFNENLSPAAERHSSADAASYSGYISAKNKMESLSKEAKAQGLSVDFESKDTMDTTRGRRHYGGGPVIDHTSILQIGGAISAGVALIKAARPIIIEYLKSRRGSFTFEQGDIKIHVDGPESLEKVEAHMRSLISAARSEE